MKPLIITAILLTAVLGYLAVQSGFEAHAEQKVGSVSPYANSMAYLSLEERLLIIERLKQSVDDGYAALDLKKRSLGIDATRIFAEAQQLEKHTEKKQTPLIKDGSSISIARANLEFFDRIRQLIALFQDTHFAITNNSGFPMVHVGIKSSVVDGKVFVSNLDSKRLSSEGIVDLPEIGDEIIAVNGQPTKGVIEHLGTFVSASSLAYREAVAATSITRRNFIYPKAQMLRLKIRSRKQHKLYEVALPWAVQASPRNDAVGVISEHLDFKIKVDTLDDYAELLSGNSEIEDEVSWFDVDHKKMLAYRTGFIRDHRGLYGVIQIFSFFAKTVTDGNKVLSASWRSPIIQFINELKRKNIPLVLDLRNHRGGHISHASDLMRMITRQGESYSSFTEAFRVAKSLESLSRVKESELDRYSEQVTVKYLKQAIQQKKSHTIVWAFAPTLGNEPEIGGYNEPIIALVSPFCISACEYLASMIKSSQRGQLIGTHTNGSGTAFYTLPPYVTRTDIELSDGTFVNIPNKMIGQPGPPGQSVFLDEVAVFNLSLENRPVSPDKPFFEGPIDLMMPDRAWFEAAKALLRKQKSYLSH